MRLFVKRHPVFNHPVEVLLTDAEGPDDGDHNVLVQAQPGVFNLAWRIKSDRHQVDVPVAYPHKDFDGFCDMLRAVWEEDFASLPLEVRESLAETQWMIAS